MKTMKFFRIAGLALVLGILFSIFADAKTLKDPGNSTSSNPMATYVVYIDKSFHPTIIGYTYTVVVTNESGDFVVTPQAFIPGVYVYKFQEIGNFFGTRVARVITEEDPTGASITLIPHKLTEFFMQNQSYTFKILSE